MQVEAQEAVIGKLAKTGAYVGVVVQGERRELGVVSNGATDLGKP